MASHPWNHSFSISLAIGSWLKKNSQRWHLLVRTSSEVFVMLVVVVRSLLCWLLLLLRFRATFSCHWHSTLASQVCESLHRLWALPWLLSIALIFRLIFSASDTVLRGHFLLTSVFYLTHLPHIFATTFFYQGLPGSRQFFLEVCRASCWSLKYWPSPYACLIHSNLQSWY